MHYNKTKIYGTAIFSDIELSLSIPETVETRHTLLLITYKEAAPFAAMDHSMPLYQAHGRRVRLYSDRKFAENRKGQSWCYEVEHFVRFYWKSSESTLLYEFLEREERRLFSFWLVHLFLPLYFTLEGVYDFFHGGAVELDGKAVMFSAPSMGGKSTMTDFFLRQGHPLISDDKIASYVEEGRLRLVPSHPYHRPYRKPEVLGDLSMDFCTQPLPLNALYLLEGNNEDDRITIEAIRGYEKFDALGAHYLYAFDFLNVRRFSYLAGVLDSLPLFRLRRPWDRGRLPELYKVIRAHCDTLNKED